MLVDGMMAGFNEGMTGEDDLDSDAMEEEAERMSSLHKAAPGCVREKPAGPPKICRIAGGKEIDLEAEHRPEKPQKITYTRHVSPGRVHHTRLHHGQVFRAHDPRHDAQDWAG